MREQSKQREIKFRAWDKTNEAMWKDPPSLDDYGDINSVIESLTEFKDDANDCGPFVFMQYTGLKDKNGVEIYEGDIVEKEDYGTRRGVIKWGFSSGSVFNGYYITKSKTIMSPENVEVIGNIYENPELVGGK